MACLSVAITPLSGDNAVRYLFDSEEVQLLSQDGYVLCTLAIGRDGFGIDVWTTIVSGVETTMQAAPMIDVSIAQFCGVLTRT